MVTPFHNIIGYNIDLANFGTDMIEDSETKSRKGGREYMKKMREKNRRAKGYYKGNPEQAM